MGVGLAYLWFHAYASCPSIRRRKRMAAWERRRMGAGGLSARTRTHTRRRTWLAHDPCHARTQQTVAHPVANAWDDGYLFTRAGAAAAGLIWYNLKRQLWFWKYRGNYSGYALPEFSPHAARMRLASCVQKPGILAVCAWHACRHLHVDVRTHFCGGGKGAVGGAHDKIVHARMCS